MNKHKLLEQLYNSQKNVSYNDFIVIIHAFGFIKKRQSGSHTIFRNDIIGEMLNIQNVNGQAKPYQIKQFLSIIEKQGLKPEDK